MQTIDIGLIGKNNNIIRLPNMKRLLSYLNNKVIVLLQFKFFNILLTCLVFYSCKYDSINDWALE